MIVYNHNVYRMCEIDEVISQTLIEK